MDGFVEEFAGFSNVAHVVTFTWLLVSVASAFVLSLLVALVLKMRSSRKIAKKFFTPVILLAVATSILFFFVDDNFIRFPALGLMVAAVILKRNIKDFRGVLLIFLAAGIGVTSGLGMSGYAALIALLALAALFMPFLSPRAGTYS